MSLGKKRGCKDKREEEDAHIVSISRFAGVKNVEGEDEMGTSTRVPVVGKLGEGALEDGDVGDLDAGGPSCPVVDATKRNAGASSPCCSPCTWLLSTAALGGEAVVEGVMEDITELERDNSDMFP